MGRFSARIAAAGGSGESRARWVEVKSMKGSLNDRPVGMSQAQFNFASQKATPTGYTLSSMLSTRRASACFESKIRSVMFAQTPSIKAGPASP